jgi:septum formation protein
MVTGASPLTLASASPRRRELLARLGLPFRVSPVSVAEAPLQGEAPAATARRLALLKLRSARRLTDPSVTLAADTVVGLEGVALGKPRDPEEARRMLRRLRARAHLVHTGVAVGAPGLELCEVETTRVRMRPYTEEELERYVATGDPLDKAGAYAIQDADFHPVLALEGSYTNVVGLPLPLTARLLGAAGLPARRDDTLERPL